MPQSRMTFPTPRKPAPVARCIECASRLGCCLHRARDAIRSKPSPEAVRGDRKVEGGTSAAAGDESAPGSVNLSLALLRVLLAGTTTVHRLGRTRDAERADAGAGLATARARLTLLLDAQRL